MTYLLKSTLSLFLSLYHNGLTDCFLVQCLCHRRQHLCYTMHFKSQCKMPKPTHEEPKVEWAYVLSLGHYRVGNPCWFFIIR